MALANSSLAMAADRISETIETALTDIKVVVDTPSAAQKTADRAPNHHYLNVFFYRIAPSAVHTAQTMDDPLFLRVFALLTPFPRSTQQNNAEDYPALRILGEVVRFFHENPVGPILQTPLGATGTAYRIQAILQAPNMEELNHIWTTQGSDLGYRMSAAYEFALIPVDPEIAPTPAGWVESAIVQVEPSMDHAADISVPYDMEFSSAPKKQTYVDRVHLPRILVVGPDGPTDELDLLPVNGPVEFVLAGQPEAKAHITFIVQDGGRAEIRRQTRKPVLKTPSLADPAANWTTTLNCTGGKLLIIEMRPADDAGVPLEPQRVGNTLTLTIDGGP
ncbi:Pvc16 family protein [Palleronia caenipelagi]|nr:Pvc16 family protein [Palleronia caenipelagi]